MQRTVFAVMLVLPCLALPALADDPKPAPQPATHARGTWEQHFTEANTTHDGHLTAEQAKAGYPTIAKHFAEIDTGGKGFVTLDDVRAWHKVQRAAHPPATENKLRPRNAYQPSVTPHPAVKASSQGTVPRPTTTVGPDAPRTGGAPG